MAIKFRQVVPLAENRETTEIKGYTVDLAYVPKGRINWEVLKGMGMWIPGLERLSELGEHLGLKLCGGYVNPHPSNWGVGKLLRVTQTTAIFTRYYATGSPLRETWEFRGQREVRLLCDKYCNVLADGWDTLPQKAKQRLLSAIYHGVKRLIKYYTYNNGLALVRETVEVKAKLYHIRTLFHENPDNVEDYQRYWENARGSLRLNKLHKIAIGICDLVNLPASLRGNVLAACATIRQLGLSEFDQYDPAHKGMERYWDDDDCIPED